MANPLPPLPATWPEGYPLLRTVSASEAREMDLRAQREHGIPSLVLMEHAGIGVAHLAARIAGPEGRILVLCGPGNNGGDGYAASRFLAAWGHRPRLLRVAPGPPRGDDAALEAALAAKCLTIEDGWEDTRRLDASLAEADLIVDAIFGVGAFRVDDRYRQAIERVNAAPGIRLAVDIPSGLDPDLGEPRPVAVLANATATLGAPKQGLLRPGAGSLHSGRVVLVDIGLPSSLLDPFRLRPSSR